MRPSRTLTVLFTDLVGSTRLQEELGDDEAQRLRRAHFRLLRRAVAAHGGQEVKSLGDGLMVVYPSVVDALDCAVAMQQAVRRDNRARKTSRPLAVRVGLHAGEPIQDEDDYFGSAVVVARRLCDIGGGDQITVSSVVRGLVGSRRGYAFRALGAQTLRGMAEPVPVFELAWQPDAKELSPPAEEKPLQPPLPAVLRSYEHTKFVGRHEELSQLQEVWGRVRAGQRRLVFLTGDAGIGKTRLAAEFALAAHAEGAAILFGRSDEEPSVPYHPFIHALRDHVLAYAPAQWRGQLGWAEEELARLIPELAAHLPDRSRAVAQGPREQLPGEREGERYRLFEAAASLLIKLAETSPVILILDDLHWADKPTLALLKHIVRWPAEARLLMLGTYREAELTRSHPLADTLADLRRDRAFERISLKGLTEEEVRALIVDRTGHEATPSFVRAVYEQTEGNPFFVEEVLSHLTEAGIIDRDGRWLSETQSIAELGIPEGIKEVIGWRLSRLSDACNRTLLVASVIGPQFDLQVLERVSDLSGDALLDVLDEAIAARLIAELPAAGESYGFSHTLVRRALYDELSTTRRVRLHQRVAAAIEEAAGTEVERYLPELAHHFLEGGIASKAIDYATRAGDHAASLLAYEEAADHYEHALQALELLEQPDERRRCQLLLVLGDAQMKAGYTTAAKETFLRAADVGRALGWGETLARAALGFAGPWVGAGFAGAPAVALLEEALQRLNDGHHGLRARLLARLAVEEYYLSPLEVRAALSKQAVDAARRSGEATALAYALNARYYAIWAPGSVDERLAVATEMLQFAEEAGDVELALQARHFRALGLLEQGDVSALDQEMEAYARLAEDLRQPRYLYRRATRQAMRALLDGRFEDTERFALEAQAIGQRAQDPNAAQEFAVQMVVLRREQGRLGELVEAATALADRYPAIPGWRCALALIYTELGRAEEARAELKRLAANDFSDLPQDANWLASVAMVAEVCAFLGDTDRAAAVYRMLLPHAGYNVILGAGAAFSGSSSHYLALLAGAMSRYEAAVRHFEEALRMHEKIGARPWTARTQVAYARMLLARGQEGDPEQAEALLTEALAVAGALGMPGLRDTALALKRAV